MLTNKDRANRIAILARWLSGAPTRIYVRVATTVSANLADRSHSLILRRMAHQYLIRFTNEPLQINRHAPDGISAQRFRYRFRNPRGFALFYEEEITQHAAYQSEAGLRDLRVQYVRFALHAGTPLAAQRNVCGCGPWLRALPRGLALYLGDHIKARVRGIRR